MASGQNTVGNYPQVARTACVHSSAVLIGNVHVGPKAFVGPNAVIRADEPGPDGTVAPIVIGEGSNVQDCVVVHALGGTRVEIAPDASVAHGAVIHGPCKIGAGCFVGFNSVVFKATLGDGAVVLHKAYVEGVTVPEGLCVPPMAAVRCHEDVLLLKQVEPDLAAFVERVRMTNASLVEAWANMEGGDF